jgi:hypothetical protein
MLGGASVALPGRRRMLAGASVALPGRRRMLGGASVALPGRSAAPLGRSMALRTGGWRIFGPEDDPRRPVDAPRAPDDDPRGREDDPRRPEDAPRAPDDDPRGLRRQSTLRRACRSEAAGRRPLHDRGPLGSGQGWAEAADAGRSVRGGAPEAARGWTGQAPCGGAVEEGGTASGRHAATPAAHAGRGSWLPRESDRARTCREQSRSLPSRESRAAAGRGRPGPPSSLASEGGPPGTTGSPEDELKSLL